MSGTLFRARTTAMRFVSLLFALEWVWFVISPTLSVCSAQAAQAPTIRVEDREVVLPVEVVEEKMDPKGLLIGPGNTELPVSIAHSTEITGLSADSFHIFEDGLERGIKHLSFEENFEWEVNDNVGHHGEYSCTPAGIWGAPDEEEIKGLAPLSHEQFERGNTREFHTYLLTYVPPPSPEGSCHQILVRVDRKRAKVFAPNQYCNTRDPLSDPLRGTGLGNRLLKDGDSRQPGTLPLSVQAVTLPGLSSTCCRISISSQIPGSLLKRTWQGAHLETSIAILGLLYKDNEVVSRFSDIACSPPISDFGYNGPVPPNERKIPSPISEIRGFWENLVIPTSYRTQLEVPAGNYRLELALTDGEAFGRAEVSTTVEDSRKDALGISDIALSKRYRQAFVEPRAPTQAPQYVPLIFDGQEFTPTGDTHFKRGEQFMTYVEIYSSQLAHTPPPEFFLEMKVTDTKTGELRIGTGRRTVVPSGKSGTTIPVVWTIQIDKLPPSTYCLEAQASDSVGNKTTWRVASFTID